MNVARACSARCARASPALRRYCSQHPPDSCEPTPLAKYLHRHIRFSGPLTVADYMRMCLTHPQYGYYTCKRTIFGAAGDFITAPLVTPVFSQLLAVWIANHVLTNSLHNYELVELGPGNGQMLVHLLPALQTLRTPPASLTLLEASANLRAVQRRALCSVRQAPAARWASTLSHALDGAPHTPLIVVAHEFFDALPVHVLHRQPHGQWAERLVDVAERSTADAPALRFVLSRAATPAAALARALRRARCLPRRGVAELSADAIGAARALARALGARGGAALLVDYGADVAAAPSVRALWRHGAAPLLARPGLCDVTADVSFAQLRFGARAEPRVRLWGCVPQRRFLLRLGAAERFRAAARAVVARGGCARRVDEALRALQRDYERIVGVGERNMGEVYKVAVIAPEDDGVPFGFEQQHGEHGGGGGAPAAR